VKKMRHALIPFLLFAALGVLGGCGNKQLPVAPAKGQVFYQGKPLEFGSVMFQSVEGPPARGVILPDGTFQLSTYGANDGAVVGQHQVRIACFTSQRPSNGDPAARKGEVGVGSSLIPSKYSNFDTSDLRVEVKAANEPFVFKLAD
jgi:hypothetical protein